MMEAEELKLTDLEKLEAFRRRRIGENEIVREDKRRDHETTILGGQLVSYVEQ